MKIPMDDGAARIHNAEISVPRDIPDIMSFIVWQSMEDLEFDNIGNWDQWMARHPEHVAKWS